VAEERERIEELGERAGFSFSYYDACSVSGLHTVRYCVRLHDTHND